MKHVNQRNYFGEVISGHQYLVDLLCLMISWNSEGETMGGEQEECCFWMPASGTEPGMWEAVNKHLLYYQSLYNQCKLCVVSSALWGHSFLYIQMTFFKFSSSLMPVEFSRTEASLLLLSLLSLIWIWYLAHGRCWMNVVGWVNEGCIIKDSVSKYFWGQPAGPGFYCHLRWRLPINLGHITIASLGCRDLFTLFA